LSLKDSKALKRIKKDKNWKPFTFESNPSTDLFAYDVSKMSRNEWLAFRSSCDEKDAPSIGGSSIGCVCGYDDFKHPMIFYLEKIGMKENTFTTNKFTAAGSILEDPVRSNMWAHWNGNDWVASYSANIRHREAYDPYATFWRMIRMLPSGTLSTRGSI